MKHRSSMLRKAAILIASLDQPTAESVLDQMDLRKPTACAARSCTWAMSMPKNRTR